MAKITINGNSFDPITGSTLTPASDLSQSNYIVIQTNPSLTDERRAELAALGVTILEYLPRYSYLCRYEKKDLKPIRSLPYIPWVGDYSPRLKLSEDLTEDQAESKEVDVILHNWVSAESVRAEIAAAAHVDSGDVELGGRKARLKVRAKYLTALAAIDEVRHIDPVHQPVLLNNVAREILGLVASNGNGGVPFEGEGQIVVVADTGFDNGHKEAELVHPSFRLGVDGPSRVKQLYALGRVDKTNDPIGHGTHVAGSAVGDGKSEHFGEVRGTAPKASLIVQSLFGSQGELSGLPVDLADLFSKPYHDDGARIHNNSWGFRPGKGLYERALEVDDFVYKNPKLVVCFAAGNEGNDLLLTGHIAEKTITSPGTAKNCITVGATESRRPFALTYGDKFSGNFPLGSTLRSNKMANDPESVAAISSRGPTKDKRIKPDLVAPGTFILSTKSIDLQPNDFGWEDAGDRFIFHGGTSMATPLVAGCAAVVREFLEKVHHISDPSAALVKALLINGAQQLRGTEFPAIPNPAEGFGRVNLAATVGPFPAGTVLTIKDEAAGDADTGLKGEMSQDFMVTITPPTTLLKVTLVWTDPPGEHLQNDLDLAVTTANGEERHGNMEAGSTDFDRANNVEQVLWKEVPAGEARIRVKCCRLTPPAVSQKYALVIRTA